MQQVYVVSITYLFGNVSRKNEKKCTDDKGDFLILLAVDDEMARKCDVHLPESYY